MSNDSSFALRSATPARLGVGRAGPRYTTAALLRFRADHARAIDAVASEVPPRWAERAGLLEVRSQAATRQEYLLNPPLGRRLADQDVARLRRLAAGRSKEDRHARPSVLICIGDGLSCAAIASNAVTLLAALTKRLSSRECRVMKPLFVRNARVRIQDHIGEILRPDVICMIVGERPGLATAESLSAYVIYRPRLSSLEPDRTVISNIHRGGLKPRAAALEINRLIKDALRCKASGARLALKLAAETARPKPRN